MDTTINTITIQIGNSTRDVQCPASWNDLDDRTALLFYSTLFVNNGSELTHAAFTATKLISMVQNLLSVDMHFLSQWENDCIAADAENGAIDFLDELKQVITSALAGLFVIETTEEGGTTYACKYNRTKNIWPKLVYNQKKGKVNAPVWLYAPADGLANISLYEMAHSFTLYENYLKTGDDAMANQLLATIYRPSRPRSKKEDEMAWGGDRRMPLRHHEGKVAERVRLIATMPMLTRRFLVFWFASCRQAIVDRYPKVFKATSSEAQEVGYGWGGVLLAIAEGPKGLDLVVDQHYSNAMTWLSMKDDEAEEMERRIAAMGAK